MVLGSSRFNFCPYCGTKLSQDEPLSPRRLALVLDGHRPWPSEWTQCCNSLRSHNWLPVDMPRPEAAAEALMERVGSTPISRRRLLALFLWDHGIQGTHMHRRVRDRFLRILEAGRTLLNRCQDAVEIVEIRYEGRHGDYYWMAVPQEMADQAKGDEFWARMHP